MTMLHEPHPDDERLAALAGADPDVASDAVLTAHIAHCPRCTDLVAELRSLHAALAKLPDLAPPRPLRLVPAVAPRRASAGWAALLRRISAPAMALAAVLIVVGAVGSTLPLLGSASGGATAVSRLTGDAAASAAAASATSTARDVYGDLGPAAGASSTPGEEQDAAGKGTNGAASAEGSAAGGVPPYEWILGAGVMLLAAAFLARGAAARRARDGAGR